MIWGVRLLVGWIKRQFVLEAQFLRRSLSDFRCWNCRVSVAVFLSVYRLKRCVFPPRKRNWRLKINSFARHWWHGPCLFSFFLFFRFFSGVKNSNPKEKVNRSSSSACSLVAEQLLNNFLLNNFLVFKCKIPKSLTEKFLFSRHLWRHQLAQWEYEARARNWIWLHEFTSYIIKWS